VAGLQSIERRLILTDSYVFVITYKGELNTILLSPEQFKKWANAKGSTSPRIHFYMNKLNCQWIDDRENVNYVFTSAAENWKVIDEIL
jgi:hypothetical protein